MDDDVILKDCPFKVVKDYEFWLRYDSGERGSYLVDYYVPEIGLGIHGSSEGLNAYKRRALLRQKNVMCMILEDGETPNWENVANNMPRIAERFKDEDKDFKGNPELYLQEEKEKQKYEGYDIYEPSRNMSQQEAMDMAQ